MEDLKKSLYAYTAVSSSLHQNTVRFFTGVFNKGKAFTREKGTKDNPEHNVFSIPFPIWESLKKIGIHFPQEMFDFQFDIKSKDAYKYQRAYFNELYFSVQKEILIGVFEMEMNHEFSFSHTGAFLKNKDNFFWDQVSSFIGYMTTKVIVDFEWFYQQSLFTGKLELSDQVMPSLAKSIQEIPMEEFDLIEKGFPNYKDLILAVFIRSIALYLNQSKANIIKVKDTIYDEMMNFLNSKNGYQDQHNYRVSMGILAEVAKPYLSSTSDSIEFFKP